MIKFFAAFNAICFSLFFQGHPGVGFFSYPKAAFALRTWGDDPAFRYTGEVNLYLGMAFWT
jgi:hypothetical protein